MAAVTCANHTMFWQVMGPNGGAPAGDVQAAIVRDLGGFDTMQMRLQRGGLAAYSIKTP